MRFCGHCGAPATAAPPPPPAQPDVADALRSFVATQVADRLVESGGTLPQERRLITALFADVSGFTRLADQLDPEELLEVIDPIISGLSSIVGRYEGYVEKFAGDALLALFGAPVTHEDDAARALSVALEMHRELERLCVELGREPGELTLHVGINSGHGIARILGSEARTDYAVLGDSVILAQRLESAAPPGETYVSATTRRLTQGRFEFEPVGELTLKGKSEPVPAWRLVGERRGGLRFSTDLERAVTPLVGREAELTRAAAALAALKDGTGAVVSVTGEAGVGKSRLIQHLREHQVERGVRWLDTRCLSYGAGLAYWPYAELLRVLTPSHSPFFERLLGLESPPEIAELEPQAFRRGLHEAFAAMLRGLADEGPLVLLIEDVHWADASSLELTRELATLSGSHPIALLLVARPEAQERLSEIAADLPSETVALEPFDDEGVGALVAAALEGSVPRELAGFVRERTGGNPLFVEELVRSLRETEALYLDDGCWRTRPGWDATAVPVTIEELLASRIDGLPRTSAALLATTAVIGRRVRLSLLGAVEAEAGLGERLARLVERGFLEPCEDAGEEAVVFHHALVQDVAYARLLRRQRRELHRRVAEIAESMYGAGDDVVDLLARHLYLGEAGAKAVEYLVRAGERARRLYANPEAITHLSRAAELTEEERRPEIELELAALHELVGDYEEAQRLYDGVRKGTNDVRAWRGSAATLRKQGRYLEALELLTEAFSTPSLQGADLAPLWLENGWTLSVAGRFDQAIDVFEAGLEAVGGRCDDVVGHLLLQLARAETVEGHPEPALAHARQAQDILEAQDDLAGSVTALRILGSVLRSLERLDEAAAALRRGLELAERIGSAEEVGGCLINLAWVLMASDSLTEAIACDRRAIQEFERIGHGSGRAHGYANLADKLTRVGEYEEALRFCGRATELARSIGHSLVIADVTDTIASIRLEQGDLRGAVEAAEEAAALYRELGAEPQAEGSLEIAERARARSGPAPATSPS